MTVRSVPSYCRICEALCGIVVDVDDDGRIVKVRGDERHPVSKGYLCPKGAAMAKVVDDPDRVRAPLRRRPGGAPGDFEPVDWATALDDIASRLRRVREEHSPHAIAMYMGNPPAFSISHIFWCKGFLDAIGSRNFYSAAPQDTFGRQAASLYLYGSGLLFPIPDIPRSSFVLIAGGNPLVSHGSILSLPRIREELQGVVDRGGRVVVVDPVRTKTAAAHEHLSIRPGTDAWLFAAMLRTLFVEGAADLARARLQARGVDELRVAVDGCTPALAAEITGIPADAIRDLALAFAAAPSAAAYGRVGLCRSPKATVANFLLDALNVVSGNFDRPGGWVFGHGPIDLAGMGARFGMAAFGRHRSRVGDLRDLGGHMAWVLPEEMTTPGREQVRALITSGGNPVLSAPDGDALEAALPHLDIHVSLDMYVNETNRYADYILPAPTFLERSDIPIAMLGHMPRSFIQTTDPVVPAPGTVREEWEVYDDLAARMGLGGPFSQRGSRFLARVLRRFGARITPTVVTNLLLRVGRSGLTMKKLAEHPHGLLLEDAVPVGVAAKKLQHKDRRVHLDHPDVLPAIAALAAERPAVDPERPLLLVGRRDLRSINSWLHNVRTERGRDGEPTLWVNPLDAAALGAVDAGRAVLAAATGSIEVKVEVTDAVGAGTVCYPHGWGHRGGWQVANRSGGANVNRLASAALADKDPLSGASHLDGIPVSLAPSPMGDGSGHQSDHFSAQLSR